MEHFEKQCEAYLLELAIEDYTKLSDIIPFIQARRSRLTIEQAILLGRRTIKTMLLERHVDMYVDYWKRSANGRRVTEKLLLAQAIDELEADRAWALHNADVRHAVLATEAGEQYYYNSGYDLRKRH